MTVLTTRPSDAPREGGFGAGRSVDEGTAAVLDRELERQHAAARTRVLDRTAQRSEHEYALSKPGGIEDADTPERIAKRWERLERYYTGAETTADDGRDLEKVILTRDFVDIRYLDAGVAAARATGRVNIRDPRHSLVGYGTGFLVTPTLLLTNHHVLPNEETARSSVIEFDYQDGIDGKPLLAQVFPFDPGRFFVADRDLDFALVAVRDSSDQLAQFGFNALIEAEGKAIVGEFVTIVQHPRGEKKQIALRENKIVDIPERFVHYSADTEPGSSGSPVFNDQWEVVALHHASVPAPRHSEFGGFLNEGVRVSRIIQFLRDEHLSFAWNALAGSLFADEQAETQTSGPPPRVPPPLVAPPIVPEPLRPATTFDRSAVTFRIPFEVTVRLGSVEGTASVQPGVSIGRAEPVEREAISIDPDYTNRRGFDSGFLSVPLPLPLCAGAIADVASVELRYHHFSVVMNCKRALALFTAVNIDGRQTHPLPRENDRWILDPRLPANEQTGEAVYRNNALDRGHLVRRLDPVWGPNAQSANDDTFHFTNSTPQHHEFNAGKTLWLGLEEYVLENADKADLAISVVAGPVLAPDDPQYRGVALPRQFWKVVAMVKDDGKLSVTGYLLSQAALLDEFTEREESFSYGAYRTFQVPVRRIAKLTGLGLDTHIAADPLEHIESTGVPRELIRPQDIIL